MGPAANKEDAVLASVTDDCSSQSQDTGIDLPVEPTSLLHSSVIVSHLSIISFLSCAANGLITVGLPKIIRELDLHQGLSFWPSSVSGLTTASTLLLAGSVADVLGLRLVHLTGCLINGSLMLACGLTRTGESMIALRAVQGLGLAMHYSSSVALVTRIIPRGRSRNIAFSCLGLSQPLGFSFGLVIGGVLVETIGWRAGWYLYGASTLLLFLFGTWAVPNDKPLHRDLSKIRGELGVKVDWIGSLLASASMTLLSYFLLAVSTDPGSIGQAGSIVPLCCGLLALPLFIAWSHHQVSHGRVALIPNSFWRNAPFSSICITICLSFAVLNSMELFASLFFQEIQHLSALEAAIRILPSLIIGIILNITTGLFVHKAPVGLLVVCCSLLTAGAPLLMALNEPGWSYWTSSFAAQVLMPISCDVLFTVGLIIITDTFPEDRQAVAGAVFNTSAQFGNSFGLALMQVIFTSVAENHGGMVPTQTLLRGFRASFWAMMVMMLACAMVGGIGLSRAGRIGLK